MAQLSDIAVFVQVVDKGSFTAAAEHLALSKSVVSKYVTRLEEHLDVRLLNRTTRRLSLTEAGQILYERSLRALNEIQAAEAEVSKLHDTPRGRLKINVPMSFGIRHIAPALAVFAQRYPELTIDMRLDDRQVDLIEEGFDLAIRIAELPDSSLVARRLSSCRHVVCASPAYLEKHGEPQLPEQLSQHAVLNYQYQASPNQWHFIAPDGRPVSVPVRGVVTMNNSLALLEAAKAGAGILLTPSFVAGEDIKQGNLQPLLTNYRAKELSIYAIYPERRHLLPKVKVFVDFMKDYLDDPPFWD